jgi:hypothetical protein
MDDDHPPSRWLRLLLICLIGVIAVGCITIAEEAWSDPEDPTAAAWSTAQRLPSVRSFDIGPDLSPPALSTTADIVVPRIAARSAARPERPGPARASVRHRPVRAPPIG